MFQEANCTHVFPSPPLPTWRNGQLGQDGIGKRLDRLYLSEDLDEGIGRFRSWVHNVGILHHMPICLQLEVETN